MTEPSYEDRIAQAFGGLTVFYACNVAALLLIAGGLWFYNHGFVDARDLDPAEGALSVGDVTAFPPSPQSVAWIEVSNPMRAFHLACEVARWAQESATILVAWCPAARLETGFDRREAIDHLADLADLDLVEADDGALELHSSFGTPHGEVVTRMAPASGGSLACLAFALAGDAIEAREDVALFGQICLRNIGADARGPLRAILASIRVAGSDVVLAPAP